MSAFYKMTYVGTSDSGHGALYIGKGVVVGIDIGDIRYHGTYTVNEGHLHLDVAMTAKVDGQLVTGQPLPAGKSFRVTGSVPENFADGRTYEVLVEGRKVLVVFEKIGNVS